jgi:pyruvate/2-oxoglutarate dehydrogenase complex dihydrolipoamide acyltransferase (E2) component
MPIISVRIPQLGEGLQEALLVDFLKKPGDSVNRDEPIYVMETDKATTDVESPYEGKLIEWVVESGTVLEIGAEVAKMEVAEGVKEMPVGHGPNDGAAAHESPAQQSSAAQSTSARSSSVQSTTAKTSAAKSDVMIPPRTRKYLKEKGLMDVANEIPAASSKLTPEDVDRYLQSRSGKTEEAGSDKFDFVDLSKQQQTLNYRLKRGTAVCVPVTVMNEIDWTALEKVREQTRDSDGPTTFSMCLWAVVQSMKKHDAFRSTIASEGKKLKVWKAVNLGVAVALPGDQLVTAVVRDSDKMSQSEFFAAVTKQITSAREGQDQVDESTTMTVSNIGKAGMRLGIPAIVAPAVATLAIGATYWQPIPKGDGFAFTKMATATLSFDHRVINGIGAANFLNDVKAEIEGFSIS